MDRLKIRPDFLRVARGHKQVRRALVVQARSRVGDSVISDVSKVSGAPKALGAPKVSDAPRVGFTVTKKVGNAVVRNRVRRRLKEAVRLLQKSCVSQDSPSLFLANTDYVVVGRLAALTRSFTDIQTDLESALSKIADQIHASAKNSGKKAQNPIAQPSHSHSNALKEQGNTSQNNV